MAATRGIEAGNKDTATTNDEVSGRKTRVPSGCRRGREAVRFLNEARLGVRTLP